MCDYDDLSLSLAANQRKKTNIESRTDSIDPIFHSTKTLIPITQLFVQNLIFTYWISPNTILFRNIKLKICYCTKKQTIWNKNSKKYNFFRILNTVFSRMLFQVTYFHHKKLPEGMAYNKVYIFVSFYIIKHCKIQILENLLYSIADGIW